MEITSTISTEMKDIRVDFQRTTQDIPPIGDCHPLSPQSYHALSSVILESIYTAIEQLSALSGGIEIHHNIGIILYRSLLEIACTHYFQEYEKLHNLTDLRSASGIPIKKRTGFEQSRFQIYKSIAQGKLMSFHLKSDWILLNFYILFGYIGG